eukprot:CAMPEP_0168479388 /NCGR_PEP_ID=MMETSP0228-20121227/63446_1 /TAXON_ID=133427 /ORGANISM="Protoceratium reticulatum, Strain CCCM 535 (=CCMP 1889)" /LENGTH=260 /DNA_ID=CAMNT_0008495675 /DNA_START=13 /DNA_END=792 /DNA_ORIENTATION=+
MSASSPSTLQCLKSQFFEMWQRVACKQPQVADFLCPITGQIMDDPVLAADRFNYERAAIEAWLETRSESPQTKQPMGKALVTNEVLRKAIEEFKNVGMGGMPDGDRLITWDTHGQQPIGEKRSATMEGCTQPKRRRVVGDSRVSMSQAMSKAFRELDPLRDLLRSVLDGWTPPKVVVIGDESAGKSTQLEQLAMIPVFPRKKRFCTRLAVHLRLRRGPESRATLCVHSVSPEGEQTPQGAPRSMPQENGWVWVQDEMQRL